jgi:hypothetical protein
MHVMQEVKNSRQPSKIATCNQPNRWLLKKIKTFKLIFFMGHGGFWVCNKTIHKEVGLAFSKRTFP